MFDVRASNIAIELWGMAFCVIGILCALLFARKGAGYRNVFVAGFALELIASGGDAAAGAFRGQTDFVAWVMVHVGNYATYFANFLLVVVLTSYLVMRIREAGGPHYETWRKAVLATCIVMCILAMTGLFFSIDSDNVYHRTAWYWIALAYAVVIDIVGAILVLVNRRKLGSAPCACFLFYTLVPVVAALMQMFIYGLNFVIVAGVMGLIVVFFEMQVSSARALVSQTEELAKSRVEVSESRIAVMVSQIQPHFLFNTLDTVYGLVDEDTELAKEAIASFSRYLRTNLGSLSRMTPVPIEAELEHLRTYLELERMSDEERVRYELDIQATGFSVPALSVQTLAENAVKHGIAKRENGGTVIIRTREQVTEYTVAVVDDGVGFDADTVWDTSHVGIANTRARLETMCGGSLEVHSEIGAGTTVVMHIPKDREA